MERESVAHRGRKQGRREIEVKREKEEEGGGGGYGHSVTTT